MGKRMESWRARVRQLKQDTYALYLAYRHPDTPWYARLLAICVVAYAASPIDLIPDVIPVLGYLDDLILVPLGLNLAIHLIPEDVMSACREQAAASDLSGSAGGRVVAGLIIVAWIVAGGWLVSRLAQAVGWL